MGYSQLYTININHDCSRLSHVWRTAQFLAIFEKSEWPCRIESRVCIYLFNDLAQYFFAFYYYITFYCMLYEHIWNLLNIFHTITNSYHILLTSTVDLFVLLTGFEPGRFILRCRHFTPRLLKPMEFRIHFVY